jgi:SAM-dependent methyltransferase
LSWHPKKFLLIMLGGLAVLGGLSQSCGRNGDEKDGDREVADIVNRPQRPGGPRAGPFLARRPSCDTIHAMSADDTKLNLSMRDFWDEKARENAMYYISSYRPYDQQDPEEFWKWGGILAEKFLAESGCRFTGEEAMLEIGCGVGRMTKYFAARFRHVTAVDVSSEMIERAREYLAGIENVRFDVVGGSDLAAYPDGSFDFVFSYIVFQHIPDPSITLNYIREAGRVLRPGGHFYFQVNTIAREGALRVNLGKLKRTMLRKSAPVKVDAAPGPRDLDHPAWQGSRVTMSEVVTAAQAGGLRVAQVEGEGTQYTWVLARRS